MHCTPVTVHTAELGYISIVIVNSSCKLCSPFDPKRIHLFLSEWNVGGTQNPQRYNVVMKLNYSTKHLKVPVMLEAGNAKDVTNEAIRVALVPVEQKSRQAIDLFNWSGSMRNSGETGWRTGAGWEVAGSLEDG